MKSNALQRWIANLIIFLSMVIVAIFAHKTSSIISEEFSLFEKTINAAKDDSKTKKTIKRSFLINLRDLEEKGHIDKLISDHLLIVASETKPIKTGTKDGISYTVELEGSKNDLDQFGLELFSSKQ